MTTVNPKKVPNKNALYAVLNHALDQMFEARRTKNYAIACPICGSGRTALLEHNDSAGFFGLDLLCAGSCNRKNVVTYTEQFHKPGSCSFWSELVLPDGSVFKDHSLSEDEIVEHEIETQLKEEVYATMGCAADTIW